MHFSTLPDERAERAPAAPAIRDDGVQLTNAGLLLRVRQAAHALEGRGIGPGDVVAVLLPNRVELILVLLAAWRLGAVVTPINPVLGAAEVAYQVADASARIVVVEADRDDIGVPILTLDEILAAAPGEAPPAVVAARVIWRC